MTTIAMTTISHIGTPLDEAGARAWFIAELAAFDAEDAADAAALVVDLAADEAALVAEAIAPAAVAPMPASRPEEDSRLERPDGNAALTMSF